MAWLGAFSISLLPGALPCRRIQSHPQCLLLEEACLLHSSVSFLRLSAFGNALWSGPTWISSSWALWVAAHCLIPQIRDAIKGTPVAADSSVPAEYPFSEGNNDWSQACTLGWKLQLYPEDSFLHTSGSGWRIVLRFHHITRYNIPTEHSR